MLIKNSSSLKLKFTRLFHFYWSFLRKSWLKLSSFFVLVFGSAILLFFCFFSLLGFDNFKANFLNGYGYQSIIKLNNNPINAPTFVYSNNSQESTSYGVTQGYISNAPTTFNYYQNGGADNNFYLLNELKQLSGLEPGSAQYRLLSDQILGNYIFGGTYLGGIAYNKQYINYITDYLSANNPQGFNPAQTYLPNFNLDLATFRFAFDQLVSNVAVLNVAFYSPTDNPDNIDYNYFPIDASLLPKNQLVAIPNKKAEYVNNNLDNFIGPSKLASIKSPLGVFLQALYNFLPNTITQKFENSSDSRYTLGFNINPFDPKYDTKFVYETNQDSSTTMGFDPTSSALNLKAENGGNLKKYISTSLLNPDGIHPAIISSLFAKKHHLKVGDNYTYAMQIPTLQYKDTKGGPWYRVNDMRNFEFSPLAPFTKPDFYFTSPQSQARETMYGLLNDKRLQISNLVENFTVKIKGITFDNLNNRIFVNKSDLTNFIFTKNAFMPGNNFDQATNFNPNNYFNGILSTNKSDDQFTNGFYINEPFGIYNIPGLLGGRDSPDDNTPGYGNSTIDTFWSISTQKSVLGEVSIFLNIAFAVVLTIFLIFVIVFLLLSIYMILMENKKYIIMSKTIGYGNFRISSRFLYFYILVTILANAVATPFLYLGYYFGLQILNNVGVYINISFPIWLIFADLALSLFILGAGFVMSFQLIAKTNLATELKTMAR